MDNLIKWQAERNQEIDEPEPFSLEEIEVMELRRLVKDQDEEIERLNKHICDLIDWHAKDLAEVRLLG